MTSQPIRVGFEDLKVHTIVGLLPFERQIPQNLYITLSVEVPTETTLHQVEKDELGKIPSYFDMAEDLKSLIVQSQFQTLETLCLRSAELLFNKYSIISRVDLTVKKPEAIPDAGAAVVSQTFFK